MESMFFASFALDLNFLSIFGPLDGFGTAMDEVFADSNQRLKVRVSLVSMLHYPVSR